MENKPYYIFKVELKDYAFYCEKCKKSHTQKDKKYFYNICVGDASMQGCRSCSRKYAQNLADGFNERHNRIKALSASPDKPVLI